MDKIVISFCKNVKDLRLQYHYTQRFVADKLGITSQSYGAYELGLNEPSIPNLIKLADLYDISLDELVGRKEY